MPQKYAVFDRSGLRSTQLIEGVHDIPKGAVPISDELFLRMTQETEGDWVIDTKKNITKVPRPVLPTLPMTREQVEAQRLRAYAEPLTGSDRYFAEAQRMQVMNETGWESVRAAGVARFEEIQALFPWAVDESL